MKDALNFSMIAAMGSMYLFILYGIVSKGLRVNGVSWLLWTILDGIALYGVICKRDSPVLLAVYVIGTALVTFVAFAKGYFQWTRVEAFTSVVVIACIVVTWFGTPSETIAASATAMWVAGIPYLFECRIHSTRVAFLSAKLWSASMAVALVAAVVNETSVLFPVVGLTYWLAVWLMLGSYPKKQNPSAPS